jgi:hypothetical protein
MADLIAARDWLTVCQLPPYAPELDPVEALWSHLKALPYTITFGMDTGRPVSIPGPHQPSTPSYPN